MNLIYRPQEEEELVEDAEGEEPLEDLEIGYHDRKTLDLEPLVREQVILSVPMAPHCKEGCLGLCAECGQNRNERDCGHRSLESERPFASLKNLKVS